ncbi:hypothetical protein F5Y15DRAFT_419645 [Xylariaceae sp. FL0016]|nr:hypothetical protein F5Y15DRAFT_419645 [Xylariaceae sp. FL0016]
MSDGEQLVAKGQALVNMLFRLDQAKYDAEAARIELMSDAHVTLERLAMTYEDLARWSKDLEAENKALKATNAVLRDEIDLYAADNDSEIIALLKRENERLQDALALEKDMSFAQKEQSDIDREQLVRRNKKLHATYQEMIASLEKLNAENGNIIKTPGELKPTNTGLIAKNNDVIAQNNQLAAENEQIAAAKGQLTAQHEQLVANNTRLAAANASLSETLARADKMLDECLAETRDLRNAVFQSTDADNEHVAEISSLRNENISLERMRKDLSVKLNRLMYENYELKQQKGLIASVVAGDGSSSPTMNNNIEEAQSIMPRTLEGVEATSARIHDTLKSLTPKDKIVFAKLISELEAEDISQDFRIMMVLMEGFVGRGEQQGFTEAAATQNLDTANHAAEGLVDVAAPEPSDNDFDNEEGYSENSFDDTEN